MNASHGRAKRLASRSPLGLTAVEARISGFPRSPFARVVKTIRAPFTVISSATPRSLGRGPDQHPHRADRRANLLEVLARRELLRDRGIDVAWADAEHVDLG